MSKSIEGSYQGPSQTTCSVDGLDAHTHSLKHLIKSVKRLQEALDMEYKMGVRIALAGVLMKLQGFRVRVD